MSDRKEGMGIDGRQCKETAVETGVPQRSLLSHIILAIHFSGDFKKVAKEVDGYVATSFVDDCRWLVKVDSVEQLCELLARAEIKVIEGVGEEPRCL